MENISEKLFEEFVVAAHRVAAYGLTVCASGNMSWRIGDDLMLITQTDSWMSDISIDQVAVCRVSDMEPLNGKKPSKEIRFHSGILGEREDVDVVLHYQSPHATAVACHEPQIENFFVVPEIPYYIGRVGVVPYILPGSAEFAQAVTAVMTDHNLAILRNHGQVTVGKSLNEAIERATYFELACKIILTAGDNVSFLSEEAVATLYDLAKAAPPRQV